MKRKITVAMLLLCVVLVVTSCAGMMGETRPMDFAEYVEDYEYEDGYPLLNRNTELTELAGLRYLSGKSSSYCEIHVFTEDSGEHEYENYYFFNLETGKRLDALTIPTDRMANCFYVTVFGHTFVLVLEQEGTEEDRSYELKMYDANGSFIGAKDIEAYITEEDILNGSFYDQSDVFSIYDHVAYSQDLFRFDGVIYRVNEHGNATKVVDNPFVSGSVDYDIKTQSYYYTLDDTSVTVYGHDLKEVYYWELPYEVEVCHMNVLSEDVVLVQMLDRLPEEAAEYDLFEDGAKMRLTSLLLDVESGKEESVDLDYLVEIEYNVNRVYGYEIKGISKDITDLAEIYYIKDGRMYEQEVTASLDGGNASLKCEIVPEYRSMRPVAENRWYCRSESGKGYIVDEDGEIKAEMDGSIGSYDYNEKFINADGKLYNFDLQPVYDYESEGLELEGLMGHTAILKDEAAGEYYRYDGTYKVEIPDYRGSSDQYYFTLTYESGTYTYTYYNENGAEIFCFDLENISDYWNIYSYDGGAGFLMQIEKDGQKAYYKVTP